MANFLVASGATDAAAITTAYNTSIRKSMRVYGGPITVILNVTGPTSIEVSFDFAAVSTDATPNPATDTDWFSVSSGAAILSTEISAAVAAGNRHVIDLSSRNLTADSTIRWNGKVPPGVGWMRVSVKRTGSAVSAIDLRVVTDGPAVVLS